MCCWRKRGAEAQAIGRSRGGRSTKIHAVVDGCGRPVALRITPGQRGDAPIAIPLLEPLPPSNL
ncbi:transposase, partial [Ochrobactrum quorumnocens]